MVIRTEHYSIRLTKNYFRHSYRQQLIIHWNKTEAPWVSKAPLPSFHPTQMLNGIMIMVHHYIITAYCVLVF